MKTWQEFWISLKSILGSNASGGKMNISHTFIKNPGEFDLHVIEYAAYTELESKLSAATAENAELKDLVWKFDDYVVHTRVCSESFPKCTCGLAELRELRPEYEKESV